MTDAANVRELECWLTTPSMTIYRIRDALPLLDRPDCVAERRDSVIYALVVQLMSLLNPQESAGPYGAAERDDAKDALLNWARTNWSEVLRIDQ